MPSLIQKIEDLRQQPKAVRNRLAITIAFFFTFVVAGVWGVAMSAKVANIVTADSEPVVSLPSPSRWRDTVKDLSGSFWATVSMTQSEAGADSDTDDGRGALDIETLSQPPMAASIVAATTSGGVWQREYANTTGAPVLIATTSSNTFASSSDAENMP